MTDTTTPIEAMFDAQRSAIKQSHEAFEQTLAFQHKATGAWLDAMDLGDTAREQSVAVSESALNAYFDALTATMPGDAEPVEQLREAAHEQFETADEMGADSWAQVVEFVEQSVESMDEAGEEYESLVEDAVESTLDAHEQVESQSVEAAESIDVEAAE